MDKQAAGGLNPAGMAQIAPALQKVVADGDLSGIVTLVWRKGEIVQAETLGRRNIEADLPMQRDTLFRIASMTKPITSVAALMLMEEGKLKLDDPITKWAPEFADMQVIADPAGPVEATSPAPRPITIEDLMTHRAGLAYGFTSVGPLHKAHEAALGSVLSTPLPPDEWMKRLGELPLTYAPGTRMHYSHATDVLGFLVGRVAGKPFRDVLIRASVRAAGHGGHRFLRPAGEARRVPPWSISRTTRPARSSRCRSRNCDTPPEHCGGGGGLISTAPDYLKFARMLLGKGDAGRAGAISNPKPSP